MAYEGELLNYCPAKLFDFNNTWIVVVSGSRIMWHGHTVVSNKYGHMLLNTGGPGGKYFQTAGGLYDRPRFMDEQQFQRYLKDNDKFIITVFRVNIPHPYKSQARLGEIFAEKRLWLGTVHNCEALVEDIVTAGGGPRLHKGLFSLPIDSADRCTSW